MHTMPVDYDRECGKIKLNAIKCRKKCCGFMIV